MYKMKWGVGYLIAVPPSTQVTRARVVVSAIKILEQGHRLLTCKDNVRLEISVKQEPTEVTPLSN